MQIVVLCKSYCRYSFKLVIVELSGLDDCICLVMCLSRFRFCEGLILSDLSFENSVDTDTLCDFENEVTCFPLLPPVGPLIPDAVDWPEVTNNDEFNNGNDQECFLQWKRRIDVT